MNGIIAQMNLCSGMIAVLTEEGDYSVFQPIEEAELELGDEIEWDDDTSLGLTPVFNHRSKKRSRVFFQSHQLSRANLGQQLLLD